MKINRNFWAYVIAPVLSLFLLASCDKTGEVVLPNENGVESVDGNEGAVVELSLEAVVGEDMRAMGFDQSNPRTPEVAPDSIEVLCIVRSSDASDAPVYRVVKWKRDETTQNRIRLHKHRFKLLENHQIAPDKKWYIMGVIGGTWDNESKQLAVSTENIQTLHKATKVNLNVPAVSKWVEIPTNSKGEFIFQEENNITYSQMPFHSQGALVQHKIAGNTSEHDMRIGSFTVVSTAFSFKGHYDLSVNQLPALDNSSAGHKHSGMLKWIASGASENKEYVFTNANITEYKHTFQLPEELVSAASSTGDGDKVMTFWVMPTGQEVGKARTNVFLDATASGGSYAPKVRHLPSYGKNHDKILKNGDFAKITSVIHRPKLAIEYMAEYNVRRNNKVRDWVKAGDLRENGSSREFAEDHGVNAASELRWLEAKEHGINGYHLPTRPEWEGVIPFGQNDNERINLKNDATPVTMTKNVRVGGVDATVQMIRKIDAANKTAYAIHFIGNNSGNKMRVAYRYRVLDNPDMPSEWLGKDVPTLIMRQTNRLEAPNGDRDQRYVGRSVKMISVAYLSVEMIYLGEYFLGTIDDIANDAWWSSDQHNADMVKRHLSGWGNRLIAYEYATVEEYPRLFTSNYPNQKSLYQSISPWVLTYWLDDPQVFTNIERTYPGLSRDKNVNLLFYFSPMTDSRNGGNITQSQILPGEVGLSVRLFSDN